MTGVRSIIKCTFKQMNVSYIHKVLYAGYSGVVFPVVGFNVTLKLFLLLCITV